MPKSRAQIASKPAAVTERRRTKRMPLSFHIEVSGHDRTGAPFRERTVTSDVNENGCKFAMLRSLDQGDLVTIVVVPRGPRNPDRGQPTIFQVVWVEPSELGWTVGATTLHYMNIWHMSFPTQK